MAFSDGLIVVRGARTHNLQRLDVDIPRGQLVVITGVSGSGKSSLAFDTLYAEGQRRYLDCLSHHARQFLEQLDRPPVDLLDGLPPTVCIEQRSGVAHARSTVATLTEIHDHLRVLYARAGAAHCPECNTPISQQSPQSIVDQILYMEAGRKVMLLAPVIRGKKGAHAEIFEKIAKAGFVRARVDGEILDIAEPPKLTRTKPHFVEAVIDRIVVKPGLRDRLDESVGLALKFGEGSCIVSEQAGDSWLDHLYSSRFACPQCGLSFSELEPRTLSFNSPHGACLNCQGMGVVTSEQNFSSICPDCHGSRLQPLGRHVTFETMPLHEFTALTVTAAGSLVRQWEEKTLAGTVALNPITTLIAKRLLTEIANRLRYLDQVGVGYLSLDRPANTLSGGEFQRARLAGCLGSGLSGVCFILDEPTIGLHPRDTQRLLRTLHELRDQGSSVLVVEHDLEVVRQADYVIDLGPGAGVVGGRLLAAGTPDAISANPDSITGAFLSGRRSISTPEHPKDSIPINEPATAVIAVPITPPSGKLATKADPKAVLSLQLVTNPLILRLTEVTVHNLKNVTVEFPLRQLVCISGVSGSGKSSLIGEALVPLLKDRFNRTQLAQTFCGRLAGGEQIVRLVEVDQTPLGKSGRSNPATYSGIWDEIRKLFGKTREARARGFRASRFSFNAAEGRCPACRGHGIHRAAMSGISELAVLCPVCQGKRFNPTTLEIKFRGLNVADVLNLSVSDAATFFASFSQIGKMLTTFLEVGLGHLKLGQAATTLSGGESQRIKLAAELGRGNHEPTLFVLDEPTTGLHAHDIARLFELLRRLVVSGHSVIMIEHHLDLIALSDWVIDLGPEGGAGGGEIVAVGRAEQIADQADRSHTGAALVRSQIAAVKTISTR
jgi:excinuclease ABC subunit A